MEMATERLMNSGGLPGVPGLGARPMRLEVLRSIVGIVFRVQTGLGVSPTDEGGLGGGARHRDAVGEAVLVGTCLANDAFDIVAIGEGVAQPLHDDGGHTFTAGVAIRVCVPHTRPPVRRKHLQLAFADVHVVSQEDLGAACHSHPRLAVA